MKASWGIPPLLQLLDSRTLSCPDNLLTQSNTTLPFLHKATIRLFLFLLGASWKDEDLPPPLPPITCSFVPCWPIPAMAFEPAHL